MLINEKEWESTLNIEILENPAAGCDALSGLIWIGRQPKEFQRRRISRIQNQFSIQPIPYFNDQGEFKIAEMQKNQAEFVILILEKFQPAKEREMEFCSVSPFS